mmetsp:Transcript_95669/g.205263  ORF Transcript_95669/g.205263 Transcript_95669/m.205263 type:complete len:311 (-) Transcript_95669:313-1245(-)
MGPHKVHQVVRRAHSSAGATCAYGQWAVVVHEEQRLPRLHVPQAHPLADPPAPEVAALVLSHLGLPTAQRCPTRLSVSQTNLLRPLQTAILVRQARFLEEPVHVQAFLKGHDIEGHLRPSSCNQRSGEVTLCLLVIVHLAGFALVEVEPPRQIVSEDPQLKGHAACVSGHRIWERPLWAGKLRWRGVDYLPIQRVGLGALDLKLRPPRCIPRDEIGQDAASVQLPQGLVDHAALQPALRSVHDPSPGTASGGSLTPRATNLHRWHASHMVAVLRCEGGSLLHGAALTIAWDDLALSWQRTMQLLELFHSN